MPGSTSHPATLLYFNSKYNPANTIFYKITSEIKKDIGIFKLYKLRVSGPAEDFLKCPNPE